MKILQVNKFNYLKGGAAKYFLELTDLLKENGLKTAKFCMADPKNLPDENEKYFVSNIDFNNFKIGNIFQYAIRILYSWEAANKFDRILKSFNPDIIHLHNIYHQISPSIIHVAKKHNIPVIMHLHDYKLICPNYKLFSKKGICLKCKGGKYYNCAKQRCLKNSLPKSFLAMIEAYLHNRILKSYEKIDLFIAPSQYMKNICVEFGIPENKIKVIYNFTDLGENRHKKQRAESNNNFILYFGRLSEEKGIETAIEAMKKNSGNLKLKITGHGPEFKNLESLVSKLDLNNRVEFTGPKYDYELDELITEAKAIVIPSIWPENMPLSLLEAMASEKAVIVSGIGGMPEIINDGKTGFIFNPGDVDDLAEKIESLNKFNLNDIGKSARESITHLNQRTHFGEINKIYESLLKSRKALTF